MCSKFYLDEKESTKVEKMHFKFHNAGKRLFILRHFTCSISKIIGRSVCQYRAY